MGSRSSLFKIVIAIVCFIIVVELPWLNNFPPAKASRNAVSIVVYPLQFVVFKTFSGIESFIKSVAYLRSVQKDNLELRRKLAIQNIINKELEPVRNDNERLRSLLDFKNKNPYSYDLISAQIISRSPDNWFESVMIDKGLKEGIKPGRSVMTPAGLVGRIVEAKDHFSRVMLIIDPDLTLSVMAKKNKLIGVSNGDGTDNLIMRYINSNSDVSVGDEIVTSGASDYFPKGVPVGTISSIGKKDYDLFLVIKVKPSVEFSKLESVFVVK